MSALIVQIIIAILVVALLLWAGDKLLALWPGNSPLKQVIRVLVIVVVALWCLSLVAEFFGASMPWGGTHVGRHR